MTEETKSSETKPSSEETKPSEEFKLDTMKSFDMIHKFTTALNDAFWDEHRYLRNFATFVDKTAQDKDKKKIIVERIVTSFQNFSIKNRDAIIERDFHKLNSDLIEIGKKDGPKVKKVKKGVVYYSSAAWLPLYELFVKCNEEMMGEVAFTMWKYILFISHYTDSNSDARNVLKSLPKTAGEDFLTKQFIKVQEKSDPGNPMATLGNLFQGGAINELLSGIATNNIQPDRVQGALSGMVNNIKDTIGAAESDNPEMSKKLGKVKGLLDALPDLIGTLTMGDDNEGPQEPDINRITGPAIDLLKDIGGGSQRVENSDKPEILEITDG